MQTVHLIGPLGERFGERFQVSCPDIAAIFRLMSCQLEGFSEFLRDAGSNPDAGFNIIRGSEIELEDPAELLLAIHEEDIFITYHPEGSKSGVGKIVAAIAIAALIIFVPPAGLGAAGWFAAGSTSLLVATGLAINLAVQGITQLLAPGPETDITDGGGDQGYLFNGPVNAVLRGSPVPILYGELEVGGAPISISFKTEPYVDDKGQPILQLSPQEQAAADYTTPLYWMYFSMHF